MALAKQLMGVGFSAGQAGAIGGTYTAYTAAGSTQGTATVIGSGLSIVAGASGTNGVRLSGQVGDSVEIFNNSASSLLVYPGVGEAIAVPGTGLGSANAAYTQTTYSVVWYTKVTATQWLPTKSA